MSEEQSAPVCYRHRNRQTYLSCSRCGKPICADCRIDAPVGFHCPSCVAEGRKTTRQARSSFGGGARAGAAGTVTKTLIGANAVMFVLALIADGSISGLFGAVLTPVHLLGAEIGYGPSTVPVDLFGVHIDAPYIANGGYYRMVTAMFLHYGFIHLLFNMVVLWMLGRILERDLGPARFLAVYLLSGLAGSVAVYLFSPAVWTAGASGAVYGLFGLLILVNRKLRRDNRGIYVLLGLNLVLTIYAGFSLAGHVGGLVGGLICGAIVTFTPRDKRFYHWIGFALFLVVLALITFFQTGSLDNQYDLV